MERIFLLLAKLHTHGRVINTFLVIALFKIYVGFCAQRIYGEYLLIGIPGIEKNDGIKIQESFRIAIGILENKTQVFVRVHGKFWRHVFSARCIDTDGCKRIFYYRRCNDVLIVPVFKCCPPVKESGVHRIFRVAACFKLCLKGYNAF